MDIFTEKLGKKIEETNSRLCAGMDPAWEDNEKCEMIAPADLLEWSNIVIDTLKSKVACFKPNASFYKGDEGKKALARIAEDLNIVSILDIKAGDIMNTQEARSDMVRKETPADFVTISPYMGESTWIPFGSHAGTFVVAKSSNPDGVPFQERSYGGLSNSEFIANQLANASDKHGLVIGAGTDLEAVRRIRALSPDAWWLMPGGIGPQAKPESLKTLQYANDRAVVNASRGLTGVPKGMDWRSQEYKDLLIKRADELNELINKNWGNTPVTWKDVTVQNLLDSRILQIKGKRSFQYKNGGMYTTYFQGRHLIGADERTVNSAVHLVATTAMETWPDWKPDAVSPVMMGAIGLKGVAEALNAKTLVVRPEKEGAGNRESLLGVTDVDSYFKGGTNTKILMVEDIFSSGKSSVEDAQKLQEILAGHGVIPDIRIIALGMNNSTAIDKIQEAGFKATACLDIVTMVGLALKQNPDKFTRPQLEIINNDMKDRFECDVLSEYGI